MMRTRKKKTKTTRTDVHGYSEQATQLLEFLYEECKKEERKPPKQSAGQKEAAKKNVEGHREEGKGFDQLPKGEHKKLSKEGGETKRKTTPKC